MLAVDEMQRVSALQSLDVLDVPIDLRFELMAQVAASLFDVPLVSMTLVDDHRQWRLASWGPIPRESPLEGGICPVAMLSEGLFVVPDMTRDPRFVDNIYVREHGLRFYAGWPLKAPGGEPIGSFCIMDLRPRRFSRADRDALTDLGRWMQEELLAGVRPQS